MAAPPFPTRLAAMDRLEVLLSIYDPLIVNIVLLNREG